MAEIIRVDARHPDRVAIERAAEVLRRGGLVAFPTETVYGLGADATNTDAVRRIFAVKGRPATDPLIVHVADLDAARSLVREMPAVAVALANEFWPGPLTLVLPRSPVISDVVTAGLGTVGVRVPEHPVARALVSAAQLPIAAPSANRFSRPSPTRAEHVVADLGDEVDIVLDAGATSLGVESTVVDVTQNPPTVLRPGGVTVERLREVVPDIRVPVIEEKGTRAMPAPGMLTRHYAPATPLTLFEGVMTAVVERLVAELVSARRAGTRAVVMASTDVIDALASRAPDALPGKDARVELGAEADPPAMAARLYVALRECDAARGDRILAACVADDAGLRLALRDRLRRAAAGDVVKCG